MASEVSLLRSYGHTVFEYSRSNHDVTSQGVVKSAAGAFWSRKSYADVREILNDANCDIVHVHNTFPLISPSVFWAAKDAGVPVIMSVRNFRMFCPQAMFLRDGRICEDCVGRVPWRGVVRRCYRDSVAASALVAGVSVLHRMVGTYDSAIDAYIALSEFSRKKMIQGGVRAEQIFVKPNFIPSSSLSGEPIRSGALFVGRLSVEKGVEVLASAMRGLEGLGLAVAGGGPLQSLLENNESIELHGEVPREKLDGLMSGAEFLVMPTLTYETFGRVVVEAFSNGLPVIASRIGSLTELVVEGSTGLLFEPGNVRDLQDKIRWAMKHPHEMRRMGEVAKGVFQEKFSEDISYRRLIDIYRCVLSRVGGGC